MKVQVVLSLLALVAAEPQTFLTYNSPLVRPTIGEVQPIKTYSAFYPYTGFSTFQGALSSPFVTTGFNPLGTTVVSSRQKRSADPEPEADPSLIYTSVITPVSTYPLTTLPATSNFRYSFDNTLPAAVSLHSVPTVPTTRFTYPTTYTPLSNNIPLASPYSAYPFWNSIIPTTQFVSTQGAATPTQTPVVGRTKRSAEPEADPQILTTGFTYPAVNTGTVPTALTYTNLPMPVSGFSNWPTTYSNFPRAVSGLTNWPTTYTSGFPYTYGNYPAATTYITTI